MKLRPGRMASLVVVVFALSWAGTAAAQSAGPVVSFADLPVLQPTTPQPGKTHVQGDFNGDGMSDILWFDPTTSQMGYWTMTINLPTPSDRGISRNGVRSWGVTPGYFAGAVGDFDGDGFADILFTSAAHDLWLWTNDHHGHFVSTRLSDYPAGWQLLGSGDIDGDGYDDVLWLDPDGCQFGYWRMQGKRRLASRVIATTCGYYPSGVGYYTPSGRLSILWTSPAHDLYVWDSTGAGFRTYDLSSYVDSTVWAFGGGYAGTQIGIERWDEAGNAYGQAQVMTRTFDAMGRQADVQVSNSWTGAAGPLVGAAGYAILGKGKNVTGLYMINESDMTLSTSGVTGTLLSGNAPIPAHYALNWSYPAGWYVVGAPMNRVAPPWN